MQYWRSAIFPVARRNNEDRRSYISASRYVLCIMAKAKAEVRQATCSSLPLKSDPKFVYSLLRSVTGFSSSSSNFPNCSSPKKLASVFAEYLRSHFSVTQPKALHSRVRGYMSELRRATCPEKSHLSFCFPFSPTEFFATATNLSSSTVTGPDKVAYPMFKHLPCTSSFFKVAYPMLNQLPRSDMDLLLHILNLS